MRDKTGNKTPVVQRWELQRGTPSTPFPAVLQYADQRRRRRISQDPSEETTDCCAASESFSVSGVAGELLKAKCGAGIFALYASVPLYHAPLLHFLPALIWRSAHILQRGSLLALQKSTAVICVCAYVGVCARTACVREQSDCIFVWFVSTNSTSTEVSVACPASVNVDGRQSVSFFIGLSARVATGCCCFVVQKHELQDRLWQVSFCADHFVLDTTEAASDEKRKTV